MLKNSLTNQTLGQKYNNLIQGYKDREIDGISASLLNYDMQDIENPGTHLGLGEKDLVYCILAKDLYKRSPDTIIPEEIIFTGFVSSKGNEEPKAADIQQLIYHQLNQYLKNKIKDFLAGPKAEECLIVANSSLNNLDNSHVISIQIKKENKHIRITFLDSVGTFEEKGQLVREPLSNDIWQDEVIRGLIKSCDPQLSIVCEHPPIHPQASANCLIEAVNKQVAYDLKCQESNLSTEDIKNVRLKVNQALHLNLPILTLGQPVQVSDKDKNKQANAPQKQQNIKQPVPPMAPPARMEGPNAEPKNDTKQLRNIEPPVPPIVPPVPTVVPNAEPKNDKKDSQINQALLPQEDPKIALIQEQLTHLTKDYLSHLFREAKKLNPNVTCDAKIPHALSAEYTGEASSQANYEAILNKYLIASQLLESLNKKDPLGPTPLENFSTLLNSSNAALLKKHRDPEWKHYFKSCMVILGIIFTGVIPGLIGLLSYSSYKNRSTPLFFLKSHGEEYVDKSMDLVSKNNPNYSSTSS